MTSKAQAAIDYVTTFSWMVLGLLVVAGVLWTSGMLDAPTPDSECFTGTQLVCEGIVSNGSSTQVMFRNALEHDITVKRFLLADGRKYVFNETIVSGQTKIFEFSSFSEEAIKVVFSTPLDFDHGTVLSAEPLLVEQVASGAIQGFLEGGEGEEQDPSTPPLPPDEPEPPEEDPVVCGNGIVEAGEECEPGVQGCGTGYVCTSSCVCQKSKINLWG